MPRKSAEEKEKRKEWQEFGDKKSALEAMQQLEQNTTAPFKPWGKKKAKEAERAVKRATADPEDPVNPRHPHQSAVQLTPEQKDEVEELAGKVSITKILREKLAQHPDRLAAIVNAIVKKAMEGNMEAIKIVMERIDGKVVETRRIEGQLPITVLFQPAQQPEPALMLNASNVIEGEVREVLSEG